MNNVIDLAARRVDRIVIETGIVKSAGPDKHGRRVFWLEYQPLPRNGSSVAPLFPTGRGCRHDQSA